MLVRAIGERVTWKIDDSHSGVFVRAFEGTKCLWNTLQSIWVWRQWYGDSGVNGFHSTTSSAVAGTSLPWGEKLAGFHLLSLSRRGMLDNAFPLFNIFLVNVFHSCHKLPSRAAECIVFYWVGHITNESIWMKEMTPMVLCQPLLLMQVPKIIIWLNKAKTNGNFSSPSMHLEVLCLMLIDSFFLFDI